MENPQMRIQATWVFYSRSVDEDDSKQLIRGELA
jgi:hypothetical protein